MACGAATGAGIGRLYAELRDGGMARNDSISCPSGDDNYLPTVLPRTLWYGCSAGHPSEPFRGTERLCCRQEKRLRWLETQPAVLSLHGHSGVAAQTSDRRLVQ